jgi:mannitol-specific phosphotransferase system IIBC component
MTLKQKVQKLEAELLSVKQKAANAILDTKDNVFTQKELKKIRFLEAWAIIGPIVGLGIGLLF